MSTTNNQPENQDEGIKQIDLSPSKEETPEEIAAKIEAERLSQLEASEKLAEFGQTQDHTTGTVEDLELGLSNMMLKRDDDQKPDPNQPVVENNEVSAQDLPWVEKVEEIIEKDKEVPYREQQDEEIISKDYLDHNLGIDVKLEDN